MRLAPIGALKRLKKCNGLRIKLRTIKVLERCNATHSATVSRVNFVRVQLLGHLNVG